MADVEPTASTGKMREDLAKSGLTIDNVRARPLGPTERHTTGTPGSVEGYVIPYFDINGKVVSFYRVRLFDWKPKYRQIANTPNHIYFPPGFMAALRNSQTRAIILTEGEKKAACGVKHGFACAAVSGTDSWRNRVISMPKDSALATTKDGRVMAKLPAGQEVTERTDTIATGLGDLINLAIVEDIPIIIAYDSELKVEQNAQVQAAAAMLGYELRFRGVPFHLIRQIKLVPPIASYQEDKLGLDDWLEHPKMGPTALADKIQRCIESTATFPRHPNPRAFINKKLMRGKVPRNELQALSTAILCDLDSKGLRLRTSEDDELYYFSKIDHSLIKVNFRLNETFAKTPFGSHLYKEYNLTINDYSLVNQISAQFAGEQPVIEVTPERVMTIRDDTLYLQISNGQIVKCNATGISMQDNGQDNVLFERDAVQPIDREKLLNYIAKYQQQKSPEFINQWYEVIRGARIKDSEGDRDRKILALLYCISPWMYRWRGTQLPIEMMIGEPGSGKSTLFQMRLNISSGRAKLRNAPNDLRDWTASVASAGGLHVTDNVHMGNNQLRQQLSDEICRVITADKPMIERRKLYSDNELVETPVKCVFAVTAIKQPFANADIIQRAVITNLFKGEEEVEYDTAWETIQLERYGGREGWLAWHLVFQHRLFKVIRQKWNPRYKAKFRLINLEQLLMLAAEVFDWDGSWIPTYLDSGQKRVVAENDWALEGIKAYGDELRKSFAKERRFTARDISEWCQGEEEYEECAILKNPRMLGAYMKDRANQIATIAGIVSAGKYANAATYRVKLD